MSQEEHDNPEPSSYDDYITGLSDDQLWDKAGTPALAWADACRELHRRLVEARSECARAQRLQVMTAKARDAYQEHVGRLEQELGEALEEIERLRNSAQANRQISDGEQALLKTALAHLEEIWRVAQDADEDFNFSERGMD